MTRKRKWSHSEMKLLMDNYSTKTIQELMVLFPNRSQESVNNKIKRLKAIGKIKGGKEDKAVQRAYDQRGHEVFITIDQAE